MCNLNQTAATESLLLYKLGLKLTFFGHSHCEALLQAAVLTPVPCHLVDNAVLVPVTCVHHVLLDASAKETLRKQTQTGGEGMEGGGKMFMK